MRMLVTLILVAWALTACGLPPRHERPTGDNIERWIP